MKVKKFDEMCKEYSKYFVWNSSDENDLKINILENLGEITYHDEFKAYFFEVKHLYSYKNGKLTSSSSEITTGLGVNDNGNFKYPERLLFQSDNLEECIEKLELLISANKYNL